MNLSISNLAWELNEADEILPIIQSYGISGVECVLTKVDCWSQISFSDVIDYKQSIRAYLLEPSSLQSIFYGLQYENFSDKVAILNHLLRIINYCKIMGVKIVVFGSPNLRKLYYGWQDDLIFIFRNLDYELNNTDIKVVIEPNASVYGGEYFITISEIVEFIKINNLNNIRTMVDTHNLTLENFNPSLELFKYYDYIEHIHISEPKLKTIVDSDEHRKFSETIKSVNYDKIITYEVLKSDNLIESIELFVNIYK